MCSTAASGCSTPALRYTIDGSAGFLVVEPLVIAKAPALRAALRTIKADPHFRASLDVCVDCNSLRDELIRRSIAARQ